jgi:hypothetical protein
MGTMSDNKKFSNGEAFRSFEKAVEAIASNQIHQVNLEEGQRQMIIIALAELSIDRPGWTNALEKIALLMDNKDENGYAEMFEKLRQNHTRNLRHALTR